MYRLYMLPLFLLLWVACQPEERGNLLAHITLFVFLFLVCSVFSVLLCTQRIKRKENQKQKSHKEITSSLNRIVCTSLRAFVSSLLDVLLNSAFSN